MMKKLKMAQLKNFTQFDNHEAVFEITDQKSGLRGFIAIHRINKDKPSFGATRFWRYPSYEDALRDALDLSRLMSYKSALAGLPYGGAKGVIMSPSSHMKLRDKNEILKAYSKEVTALNGKFITGTDVGLYQHNVTLMRKYSPFMVGLRSNPTKFTAFGILFAIEVCVKEAFDRDEIAGHSFAIQGVGKIGFGILKLVYPFAQDIFVADINKKRLALVKRKFSKVKIVKPNVIHKQQVDVYVPCALSGVLNAQTIPQLQCKIVAGGANNQLENSASGDMLHKKGILYAPDYAVNAGGLISVVDEYENTRYNEKRIMARIMNIKSMLQKIFDESKALHRPTHEIANRIAEKQFNERSAVQG